MRDRPAEPKVFLGMPGYGRQTAAAGRGLWYACADMAPVHVEYRCGSLLAANFNALWCAALNIVHLGGQVDYFAMLHDDIGPEDRWLDKLIDELEARDLDVLGVVVPIKDHKGLTSIALDNPPDTWLVKSRLTMHEVYRLPETFTAEDVGHPLLLNTGCWVCRFDFEWAKRMLFTINDRIVFDKSRGLYRVQVEPEDWYFSRHLNALGLKIGATRKVRVAHHGEVDFHNSQPWGSEEFDSDYVDRSPIVSPPVNGVRFPDDVPGWLLHSEGMILAELARDKRVLEIGTYCGKSTVCLAQTAEHVTTLDYFDGRDTPKPRDTWAEFSKAIETYGVGDRVFVLHPDARIPLPKYDLAFIDGCHDLDAVRLDIQKALGVLKRDGLLAFHDYRDQLGECDGRWDIGVTRAVNEFLAGGAEIVRREETLAVVKPHPSQFVADPRHIVGLGTGRCGTHSLASLLAAQPGLDAAHERLPFVAWHEADDPGLHFQDKLAATADVGFYYLPHVERLMGDFEGMKFVCLKRDKDATVRSFCRIRPQGTNWFHSAPHVSDFWDAAFPKYDCDFETAVARYWDDYYRRAAELESDRFRIVPTESLNDESSVRGLLEFLELGEPRIVTGIRADCFQPEGREAVLQEC